MAKNALVSVVVPVYNGERFLAETLTSITSQDYSPFEILVVDNGSTDGSRAIVRSFNTVTYIYRDNSGDAAARNIGIAAGQGEFFAFLDQDDIWTPDKLKIQVGYLQEHADTGYTLSRMRVFLDSGITAPRWLDQKELANEVPAYVPSALVVRRKTFETIGDFNTTYKYNSDFDWFFRARDAQIPMAVIPRVLLLKRVHSLNYSHEGRVTSSELLCVIRASIRRKCLGSLPAAR